MNWQVPMNEVAVLVAVSGSEPVDHFIYLATHDDRRQGPETMEDYVNGSRRFFPMLAGGVPKMVNRDQIIWMRYEKLGPSGTADPSVTLIERPIIIELSDGARIEGVIPIDRPREVSRISDVLNDPRETFVRVDEETETYYINKSFIRLVIPR